MTGRHLYEESPAPFQTLEPMWTASMVSNYFSVHRYTVYRWIKEGKLNASVLNGKFRVPRSEVERLAGTVKDKLMQDA